MAYSRGNTILPNILDVCQEHGISLIEKKGRIGEYRANCPFCGDTKKKLYLNAEKNTFQCYHGKCVSNSDKQGGGVVKFIALLKNKTKNQVLEEIKQQHREEIKGLPKRPKRKKHPAERLNAFQLKEIGHVGPSVHELRRLWLEKNPEYYKNNLDYIWQQWQDHVQYELEQAYKNLIIGIGVGQYNQTVEEIKQRGEELGVDLLTPVLKIYAEPAPPAWVLKMKELAHQWLNPLNPKSI